MDSKNSAKGASAKKGTPTGKNPPRKKRTAERIVEDRETGEPQQWTYTERENLFIEYYLLYNNAKKAAIAAGYSMNGIESTAQDLKRRPKIAAVIEERRKQIAEENQTTHDMITAELSRIAFGDISDYLEIYSLKDEDGEEVRSETGEVIQAVRFKQASAFMMGNGRNIKSIKIGKGGQIELNLFDKQSALDMLAKHTGYYEKDNKQKSNEPAVQIVLPDNNRDEALTAELIEKKKAEEAESKKD